jgi:trehalose 6-phosphate phosphatase
MTPLTRALKVAAASDVVLVASDYDGTLAPIVANPDHAYPDSRALAALVSLGALPGTHAAMLSGREVAVLERLTGGSPGVELVGSHGAEQSGRFPDIDSQARQDLAGVHDRMVALCDEFAGSRVETKPAGVAFHYRNVETVRQPAAEAAARRIGLDYPGLAMLEGKRVIEYVGSKTNKGQALLTLRNRWGADVVVFIGDDVTDEDAFALLRPVDVGIKVGPETTHAKFRVDTQTHVAAVLESLLAFRRDGQEAIRSSCR